MRTRVIIIVSILAIGLLASCKPKNRRSDTKTSGEATLVSDESFTKIISEIKDVFVGTYPEASVTPIFTNEKDALEMLMTDSVRMAVLTRDLTEAEKNSITQRDKSLVVRTHRVARDAVAFIINKENPDTLISVQQIEDIIVGNITSWSQLTPKSKLGDIVVVFDNPTSSTLRYVQTEIVKGQKFSPRMRSVETNQEVMDYVARTKGAIGIIGMNWISNPVDKTTIDALTKVKAMWVSKEHPATIQTSFLPHAGYILQDKYPFPRDIYMVITDYKGGLLSGFLSFALSDKGQRIVVKAGLAPEQQPGRTIRLVEE